MHKMTYGRARLLLGITGVGSLVTLSAIALALDLPGRLLSPDRLFGSTQVGQLAIFSMVFMLWLIPLDFLGGYLLPLRFGKSKDSIGKWFVGYVPAVIGQAVLFVTFGSAILLLGQALGLFGGLLAISGGVAICLMVRNRWVVSRELKSKEADRQLLDAVVLIQEWQIFVPRTLVVKHKDIGFTGGIIGLGNRARIVIPESWLSFPTEQLATAIARRAIAVGSGSYHRGLVVAFLWNTLGFLLCSLLPNAGLSSVAELTTTVLGFTLWSFVGLLVLPTLSRSASLSIDQILVKQSMPRDLIAKTAVRMDQLQDGEPERPALIEAIFHPIPSAASRDIAEPVTGVAAWNVARTSLFFSWACMGFLSRSVHCNVGRPELWTMLPTD